MEQEAKEPGTHLARACKAQIITRAVAEELTWASASLTAGKLRLDSGDMLTASSYLDQTERQLQVARSLLAQRNDILRS